MKRIFLILLIIGFVNILSACNNNSIEDIDDNQEKRQLVNAFYSFLSSPEGLDVFDDYQLDVQIDENINLEAIDLNQKQLTVFTDDIFIDLVDDLMNSFKRNSSFTYQFTNDILKADLHIGYDQLFKSTKVASDEIEFIISSNLSMTSSSKSYLQTKYQDNSIDIKMTLFSPLKKEIINQLEIASLNHNKTKEFESVEDINDFVSNNQSILSAIPKIANQLFEPLVLDFEISYPIYFTNLHYQNQTEALTMAFVDFINTKEAKATILNNGGIVSYQSDDLYFEDIKQKHLITRKDNSSITLKLGGSTSVEPIVRALGNQFEMLAGNPKIEFSFTGSSDGYSKTIGNQKDSYNYLDIGFLSRDFNHAEPISNTDVVGIFAHDAICIIVNNDNPIDNITTNQLREIFLNQRTTWSDNSIIRLYTRDKASGSREGLLKILNLASVEEATYPNVIESTSNGDSIMKVEYDRLGLSYISFSSISEAVKVLSVDGVYPTLTTVLNDEYSLVRPFYYIVRQY